MSKSSVYEMIIERGFEQGIEQGRQIGAKAGTIQSILDLLDQRFEMDTAPVLTPLLEPINDLRLLRQLLREALEVEHLENFVRSVQTSQNGA